MNKFDLLVIGAGHAGCEAALAGARMGLKTAIFTISLENIALMSCNPSIGGPAKGHLVREIDVLGGEMGRNIDKTFLQMRVLNTRKGPAVRALRAQADKNLYHVAMKKTVEEEENLHLIQGEIVDIVSEGSRILGIKSREGVYYEGKAIVLATGTFMRGRVYIGKSKYKGGRSGEISSESLPLALERLGIKMRRFKTGTPPRVNNRTIDYSNLIEQPGDKEILKFSIRTEDSEVAGRKQLSCFLTHTNSEVHQSVISNLDKAPIFNGDINSKGPRYCPSIEDKVDKFRDRPRHQVFLEPEGYSSSEVYLNGLSTSLPANIQAEMLAQIPGLERAQIMRYGYAVEYDYISEGIDYSLKSTEVDNLFFAGQINGTTGYEEAAASGLIAGINAARLVQNREPIILSRESSYIGLMIDDLVTKGTVEPYRVLTARAEHRLLLRYDNADVRLAKIGFDIGLLDSKYYDRVKYKIDKSREIKDILSSHYVSMNNPVVKRILDSKGETLKSGSSLEELLKRPSITYDDIKVMGNLENLEKDIEYHIETEVKYKGYISIQRGLMMKQKSLGDRAIPKDFDFNIVQNISSEAKERLSSVKPINIGQASRISGVTPSDIQFLILFLEKG